MKRTLLLVCALVASLLPAQLTHAMKKGKKHAEKETSIFQQSKQFLNVPAFLLRLSAIAADDNPQTKELVGATIAALRLENFPIRVSTGKSYKRRTIERYFDCAELRKLLLSVTNDYFQAVKEGKIDGKKSKKERHEKAARYLEDLKNCLELKALKKDMGKKKRDKIVSGFDNAIAYYKGKDVKFDKFLSFADFGTLFGMDIDANFNAVAIMKVINHLLKSKPLTEQEVLECFKFKPLLEWMGIEVDDIEKTEKAVTGLITFGIDATTKEVDIGDTVLSFFAQYKSKRKSKPTKEESDDSSSSSSSDSDSDESSKKSNDSDSKSSSDDDSSSVKSKKTKSKKKTTKSDSDKSDADKSASDSSASE